MLPNNTRIDEMEWSVRVANLLQDDSRVTLLDLASRPASELWNIPRFGDIAMKEVIEAMAAQGYILEEDHFVGTLERLKFDASEAAQAEKTADHVAVRSDNHVLGKPGSAEQVAANLRTMGYIPFKECDFDPETWIKIDYQARIYKQT